MTNEGRQANRDTPIRLLEQRICRAAGSRSGIHVTDLDRSVDFYTSVLGMHVVGRFEFEGITEVLVGYGELGSAPNVVLVDRAANPGPHDLGTGFDRILVIVDDVDATCERLRAFGCRDHRRARRRASRCRCGS